MTRKVKNRHKQIMMLNMELFLAFFIVNIPHNFHPRQMFEFRKHQTKFKKTGMEFFTSIEMLII